MTQGVQRGPLALSSIISMCTRVISIELREETQLQDWLCSMTLNKSLPALLQTLLYNGGAGRPNPMGPSGVDSWDAAVPGVTEDPRLIGGMDQKRVLLVKIEL